MGWGRPWKFRGSRCNNPWDHFCGPRKTADKPAAEPRENLPTSHAEYFEDDYSTLLTQCFQSSWTCLQGLVVLAQLPDQLHIRRDNVAQPQHHNIPCAHTHPKALEEGLGTHTFQHKPCLLTLTTTPSVVMTCASCLQIICTHSAA